MKRNLGPLVVILLLVCLATIPTLLQSGRIDTVEANAEADRAAAESARHERDDLETTVSTLAGDVTVLRNQLEGAGVEPAAPPPEERIDDDEPSPPVARPIFPDFGNDQVTDEELMAAVIKCFATGQCVAPPATDGEDGEDAPPLTQEQIVAAMAVCFESGKCPAPANGVDGQDGQNGQDGQPGPTCPDGSTLQRVRAPFQSNDWLVCVVNDA